MSEWRKMTEELPPVKEMVLLSWWGTIEGLSLIHISEPTRPY